MATIRKTRLTALLLTSACILVSPTRVAGDETASPKPSDAHSSEINPKSSYARLIKKPGAVLIEYGNYNAGHKVVHGTAIPAAEIGALLEKLESEYLAELNQYQDRLQQYRDDVKRISSSKGGGRAAQMLRKPMPPVKADYKIRSVRYFATMEEAKKYIHGTGIPGSGGASGRVTVTVTTRH